MLHGIAPHAAARRGALALFGAIRRSRGPYNPDERARGDTKKTRIVRDWD
jgi:hypothetical protein